VGKSHIAAALAAAAVDSGQRVRFTSAVDMVAHLQRAQAADDLSRVRRNFYVGPPLLVIDELGYLPLDAASGHWIFHVVSKREGKGSIIITSNRGFGDWGSIFGDPVVATAIVDRLLHNAAVVINIRGNSYRMRAYHDLGDPKVEDSVTVVDKRAAEMPQEAPERWHDLGDLSERSLVGQGRWCYRRLNRPRDLCTFREKVSALFVSANIRDPKAGGRRTEGGEGR
jgi:hypothetical protein